MEYTLSIAFTDQGQCIFVEKTHGPMKGKCIFPGGRVDEGEDPILANIREFKEEIGVDTEVIDWFPLATINYPSYTLHVCLLSAKRVRRSLLPKTTDTGEVISPINIEHYKFSLTQEKGVKYTCEIDGLCMALLDEVVMKMYD